MLNTQTWWKSGLQQWLAHDGLIAYPTESVWSLGCDPFSRRAVENLLVLKNRPLEKGLICVVAHKKQMDFLLEPLPGFLQQRWQELVEKHKPLTVIIPDVKNRIPYWVKGKHIGVAVRISSHPCIQKLCRTLDRPLISTSANRSGCVPARYPWQIHHTFGGSIKYFGGSQLCDRQPTPIIDLVTQQYVRF
ncbi:MAG: L-threonylcarbamoyladenylate synthase [Pseudomonadota bacterium]